MDVTTQAGLRDRALIGLMVCSFARIGAAPAGGDGSSHRHALSIGATYFDSVLAWQHRA
jgi:hypothetical protein